MRTTCLLIAALLLPAGDAASQSVIREYRPEIVVTSPRIHGYGVLFIAEQHLGTNNYSPNERIEGIGLTGPTYFGFRPVFEARQVLTPTVLEHRYIPTLLSTIELGDRFEVRNRTRVEVRDVDGAWSHRYQDRSAFGRVIEALGLPVFTYAQIDLSYDSRFSTLNRIDKSLGARISTTPVISIDLFYTRQDDTRRNPRILYATGAILRVAL